MDVPVTAPALRAALFARKAEGAAGPRTLRELATAVGVKPSVLGHYLAGRRAWPPGLTDRIRAIVPEWSAP